MSFPQDWLNNHYPYTDFHEANLDFLLQTYQQIVDKINQIFAWVNQHEIDYNEAIRRLTAVENEIDTFEAQITEAFDELAAEQEAKFEEQTAKLDASIAAFRREMNAAMAQFRADIEALKRSVEVEIIKLKNDINTAIINLNNQLLANNEYIYEYVENRLDEFINSFPELINLPVYNPVKGTITGLQDAINDLYSVACVNGLTAFQYDSLGLTAQEYDAKDLTAIEFDTKGYILLGYPDENWYMISPFTGQYVKVKDVVMDLAHFHMDGLTAEEYDDLDLTAEEYDDKNITAFDFDWFGKDILTA